MQSIFGNIFEISEWGASEIKEILSEGEKIIDDIENMEFPLDASWREKGSWNNIDGLKDLDISSKVFNGRIYLTNERIIFEGARKVHKGSWKTERELCTINLEEIKQFHYSIIDQWTWENNQLRKVDITGKWKVLGKEETYPMHSRRIVGKKISYHACPYGTEIRIEKLDGNNEKFIIRKPPPHANRRIGNTIIKKLENFQKLFIDKITSEAKSCETNLDYERAILLWEKLGQKSEAARIRELQMEQRKVEQTVVQGDQITKTEIKDSVLNRSTVGGGSSKMQELKELKEMFDSGFISEEEMEKMKKEIMNG